jgi:predicted transglutaminase-like cysteine proteinase
VFGKFSGLVLGFSAILACSFIMTSMAFAQTTSRNLPHSATKTAQSRLLAALPATVAIAPVAEESRPPIGWVQFCRDHAAECSLNENEADVITLTPQVWRTLQKVNVDINKAVNPITDIEHHGVAELWSFPQNGKGDCEDYALLKRKQLSDMGLPRRALLMTVVIDEQGGHAVLTVRTNRGDFVLDNKRNAILSWDETGYRFVKREAQIKGGWVAMNDPGPAVSTAGR